MRVLRPVATMLAVVFLVPAWTSAQSLAEVAAREKERRKKQQEGAKAYTEDDLAKARHSGARIGGTGAAEDSAAESGKAASATQAGPSASPTPEKTEEELAAERQQEWHKRLDEAQAEVQRLDLEIARLETALGDLTQNLYGATRRQQIERLDQAKGERTAAQKKLEDLQDEGRKNRYR